MFSPLALGAGPARHDRSQPRFAQFWMGWKPVAPGFEQASGAHAFLDGALFIKTQNVYRFSTNIAIQAWKVAAGHNLSQGMEKGIITEFANKARLS